MPWMRLRVVWGLRVTMASFSPTSAFSSVDFPALGRPMMETNPERNAISGDPHLPGIKAYTHAVYTALSGFQNFEAQAVFVEDLARFRNVPGKLTDQSSNRGCFFLVRPHAQ